MRSIAALLGFATVGIFVLTFVVFSFLNPDFDLLNDYISKLGASGQPFAVYWNAIGFVIVGIAFALFGCSLGFIIKDHLAGLCLIFAGLGFAIGAIPTDLSDADASLSRVHYASICISMAGWCLALARLMHVGSANLPVETSANATAVLTVLLVVGTIVGLCSEPIAQRLMLCVVFGWVLLISARLRTIPPNSHQNTE